MDAPDDTAWPKELCADSQTLHRTVERAASDDMKPQVQYDSSLEEQDHRGKRACNGDNGSGSIQATEVLIETNEQPSTVPEVSRLTDDLQVQPHTMDKYIFPELGRTIPDTLLIMKARCEQLPDDQWMLGHVYPALEFIFNLLKERDASPHDAEIISFCAALARFQGYLRVAISQSSIFKYARSRKVAEKHRVVYSELDRLLDVLHVPEADSIRAWKVDADSPLNMYSVAPNEMADDTTSAVQLTYFESPTVTHASWKKAGLVNEPNHPSWYLSLADVIFSKEHKIGEGSFGAVYKGSWRGTPVVVKFMGYQADDETIPTDLLVHEVRVWHRLNHPHVLRLYGACHVDKRYFVCEYAPNGELSDFLKKPRNKHVTWQKLYEAALGLQYLHGMNIVHNDLKCDNIMVGMDGNAKLIDFGLSSLVGEAEIQIDQKKMGAVHWKSPEYLTGGRPSFASDVYSFAMCIIEAVSGDIPWGYMHPSVVKMHVKRGKIPLLPESMTEKQRNLIELMTKKDPSERVKMAFVVAKLSEFARNDEEPIMGFDEHCFPELYGATIPETLHGVKVRCERLSDDHWMASYVYPALEFIFNLLKERNMSPADVEVVSFCTALLQIQRHLRTAVSERSLRELARSLEVARTHGVIYTDLDRLLDMLNVVDSDPIRAWKVNPTTALDSSQARNPEDARDSADNWMSAVQLTYFESPTSSHALWTKTGLEDAGSSPSWYLSPTDIVFSEADRIGEGSFGAVYKGFWRDTPVTVKFMGYEEDIYTFSTDLLLHEMRVWHRLNHPHVLRLYGACHVDKRYFVCEYVPNGELGDFLEQPRNKHVTWQKLYEAALGLQYLHGMNIVHNDLKCDNIMVGMDGNAKLIDFGLSSLVGEAEIQIDQKKMGAVHWKSPEYLTGGRPSFASDVYSFAMCIIEAVSGDIPWGRPMVAVVVRYQLKRGGRPNLPDSLTEKQRNLIEFMTKNDPTERVTMAFVVAKLREFARDESTNNGAP